jgi:hypothetical protein
MDDDLIYTNYEGTTPEEVSLLKNIKISIYNNLAACYLKVDDLKNTKAACECALELDPNNSKA